MQHLYFVRHGLSVMNQKGIFSGRTETPLTQDGIRQAELAGLELQHHGINCIVSSPMKRARDTAAIIARQVGFDPQAIIINDHFMERAFGALEGTPYTPDLKMDHIEGVETTEEILERGRLGLQFLQSLPHKTILVCSHGAIGRALRCAISPKASFDTTEKFDNAAVVQLI